METITLWLEGYAATGQHEKASLIGTYNAENLDEAVKQYMEENPNSVDWDRFGRGRHTIWGCEIFSNEKKAKINYG